MTRRVLSLLLSASLFALGCEKIKSLSGTLTGKPSPSADTAKKAASRKQAETKGPIPFPKDQAESVLAKQEKISTETRDGFLAGHLSKSEQDDLYFEPPADESWSKLTPERR